MKNKHSAPAQWLSGPSFSIYFDTALVMEAGSSGVEHREEKNVLKEEETACFP